MIVGSNIVINLLKTNKQDLNIKMYNCKSQ